MKHLRRNNVLVFSGAFDILIGGYFIAVAFGFVPNFFGLSTLVSGLIGFLIFGTGIWVIAWRLSANQVDGE